MPFDLCGWYRARYCNFLKLVGGPSLQARFLKIFGIHLHDPFSSALCLFILAAHTREFGPVTGMIARR